MFDGCPRRLDHGHTQLPSPLRGSSPPCDTFASWPFATFDEAEFLQESYQKSKIAARKRKGKKMGFTADTYICLDVPMPVAQHVMDIRVRSHDTFRAALPVEITLTGSSGIGVFDAMQDEMMAFALLNVIAAETEPLQATFGKVFRFPSTDIFVLTLTDERPFHVLHERIVSSGIRFLASPFPYTPHCTLRSHSPISEEEAAAILSFRLSQSFLLDTLSVYMLDTLPMTLLHQVKLTGKAQKKDLSESH
jgi:hypothetical protein